VALIVGVVVPLDAHHWKNQNFRRAAVHDTASGFPKSAHRRIRRELKDHAHRVLLARRAPRSFGTGGRIKNRARLTRY
jgi:hypothetical protein